MEIEEFVTSRVHRYYWHDDLNCACTSLKILSEHFEFALEEQVLQAAIGMHGAGCFGAQCGLVEGALMFLGMYGSQHGLTEQEISENCYRFAEKFQQRFESLLCREIRPEGFNPDNPPHPCTAISEEAIIYTIGYISQLSSKESNSR